MRKKSLLKYIITIFGALLFIYTLVMAIAVNFNAGLIALGFLSAVFITNTFHIYRAEKLSKRAGVFAAHISAGTGWYTAPMNYVREMMAVVQLWIST